MVDITKTLSVCVVTRMNKKGGDTEHEKQVFEYGVELMLNSILKIFVYMIIVFFIGREKEIIVAIGLFSILRKISGGKHAKSDMGCFITMGSILSISVLLPSVMKLSKTQYILIALIVWSIYLINAPMDDYYLCEENIQEKGIQKIKVIIEVGLILILGFYIDKYWSVLILIICASQAITLIEFQKKC